MAIVKSSTGKFYDMDDNALEGKEVKPQDLPAELQRGPGPGGPAGLAGLVQVVVNLPGGGKPPPSGQSQGAEDVVGHHYCGWRNCWRNCW